MFVKSIYKIWIYKKSVVYLYQQKGNKTTTKNLNTMTTQEHATILGTLTILLNRAFENGMTPEQALQTILEGVKNGETNELMFNVKKYIETLN